MTLFVILLSVGKKKIQNISLFVFFVCLFAVFLFDFELIAMYSVK